MASLTGYGYQTPKFGARRSPLTYTLGGGPSPYTQSNPFGLGTAGQPAQSRLAQAAPPAASPATVYRPQTTAMTPAAPRNAASQTDQQQSAAPVTFDPMTDPALQQVYAYSGQQDQQAQAAALRDKTQLLEQYGDPNLARKLGLGDTVAQAAEQNPNSLLARLKKSYEDTVRQQESGYNRNNLFYSGARVKGLQDLANQYSGSQADLASQVRQQLGGIGDALAQALAGGQYQRLNALQGVQAPATLGGAAQVPETAAPPGFGDVSAPGDLLGALTQAAQMTALQRALAGYFGPVGGPAQAAGY